MIVKDVDLDDAGNKTYVFGIDDRLEYLKSSIRTMANTIDNEAPDMMLWELRRVVAKMEDWEKDGKTTENL